MRWRRLVRAWLSRHLDLTLKALDPLMRVRFRRADRNDALDHRACTMKLTYDIDDNAISDSITPAASCDLPVISNEFVTASVSSNRFADIPESGSFP